MSESFERIGRRAALILLGCFAAGSGATLIGCGRFGGGGVRGNGVAKTETRSVTAVTRVDLEGVGTLEVTSGAGPSLSVTADDNLMPLLISDVSGETLRLRSDKDVRPKTAIVWKLTLPDVREVTLSGAADLNGHALRADALKVTLSGSGSIKLDGDVARLDLALSGAGDVDATKLDAKSVSVTLSGAGDAQVSARDSLAVDITGAGSVRYKGAPKIDKRVSGAGSVRPLG